MDNVSNDTLYNVLLEIKEDIGSLRAAQVSHLAAFQTHLEESKRLSKDVVDINMRLAKQSGAVRVWGLVATGAAAAVGGVINLLLH